MRLPNKRQIKSFFRRKGDRYLKFLVMYLSVIAIVLWIYYIVTLYK